MDFAEGLKKDSVVLLLEKYFLSSAAMVHDMIDSSRVLDTKRARDDNVNYQGKVLTVNKRFDPLGLLSSGTPRFFHPEIGINPRKKRQQKI